MAEIGEDAGESETSPLPSLETSEGKPEENEDDPFAELPSEAEKKKNSGVISPGKLLGIAIFFLLRQQGCGSAGIGLNLQKRNYLACEQEFCAV